MAAAAACPFTHQCEPAGVADGALVRPPPARTVQHTARADGIDVENLPPGGVGVGGETKHLFKTISTHFYFHYMSPSSSFFCERQARQRLSRA